MKVSLVTVTFNSDQTLRDTIQSVLNQTYSDIEYIIIDGLSKDNTVDIIRKCEPQFQGRLKWISERDNGLYDAMNKGIRMSTGEIVGIINSDDFYGQESYKVLADFLNNKASDNHFAMVGYKVSNTLTANGSVKRGICEEKDNFLTKIIESKVEKVNNEIMCSPLDGSSSFIVPDDEVVSMNMFGFTDSIFDYLEKDFPKFLDENISNLTSEYLIPDVIFDMIKKELIKMEVLKTDAKWYGVTYKEDKEEVVNAINEMVRTKKYNKNLWG